MNSVSHTMFGIALVIALSILSGCTKYNAEPFTGYSLPRETGYNTGVTNDWLYINLSTMQMFNVSAPNSDIEEGEQFSRTDWDIAFCGWHIRTNGGTTGSGKGSAAALETTDFDKYSFVNELPAGLNWVEDTQEVSITYSRTDWNKYLLEHDLDFDKNPWFDPNRGLATTITSANTLLNTALSFTSPPPIYTPSLKVFIIRSASGNDLYKLQIVSWFHDDFQIGDSGGRLSFYVERLK